MHMGRGTSHYAHIYADLVIEMEVTDVSCSDRTFTSRCCGWQRSWLGYKYREYVGVLLAASGNLQMRCLCPDVDGH